MSKQLLLSYSVLDDVYQNGSLRFIRGLQDALSTTPTVGTIDNPHESGVPLLPSDPDPKMFSYAYKNGVRVLVSKVVTPVSGTAPYTTWSLYEATAHGFWAELARDIKLQLPEPVPNSPVIATNTYGVAHWGDWLYIVDYDSQKIFQLGTNELNGLPTGSFYKLTQTPLDLGALPTNTLPSTAKGQAIIALQDNNPPPPATDPVPYLFALYINPTDAYASDYTPSILVRMKIGANGALTYDTQYNLGLNSQEIVPFTKTNEDETETVSLVIPSVGGPQQAGGNNAENSMIQSVPAFTAWTTTSVKTLVIGADAGTYDIFAIATPDRAASTTKDGVVYILTYDYAGDYITTDWKLYQTTVTALLAMDEELLSDLPAPIDSGTSAPGYFWDILLENGATSGADRLWFFRGAPMWVNPATNYTPLPSTLPPPANVAYKYFGVGNADGQIGGSNVDWVDLTIEAVRQALAGKSLKHSVRAAQPPAAAAAKAATEDKEK